MSENIIRVEKDSNYAVISNAPLNDDRLSWEAKGVLAYLLTKPDDWVIRNHDLEKKGKIGGCKLSRILAELKTVGYLTRTRYKKSDGTFQWETIVYEKPTIPRLTIHGSSIDGSSIDGKPGYIVSTESPSTELLSTEETSTETLAAENSPPRESEPPIPETPVTYPEKKEEFTLTGIWSMAIADHGQIKNKAAAIALEANLKKQVEGAVDLGWLNEYQRPLIDAFVTASGIKPVKGDYGLWRKAAGNWLLIKLTTSDIVGAVQKLRAGNLTISGPQSVTNTARAIHCNPTGEQQGTLDSLERAGFTYGGS